MRRIFLVYRNGHRHKSEKNLVSISTIRWFKWNDFKSEQLYDWHTRWNRFSYRKPQWRADSLDSNYGGKVITFNNIFKKRFRLKCGFFLLPCCPFDFYGKFSKNLPNCIKFAADVGKFGQYFTYIYSIINHLGFQVELDRLKIPSTKRVRF